MIITCPRTALDSAVSTALRYVSGRSPLPVLQHLLLDANSKHLVLAATDMNIGVRITVPEARIEEHGACTVAAKHLGELLGSLRAADVTLAEQGSHVRVTWDLAGEHDVPSLPGEEFPSFPTAGAADSVTLSHQTLTRLFGEVGFAAAQADAARPVLTGVLVLLGDGQVTMVATDGRRLARAWREVEGLEVESRCVVPTKMLAAMIAATDGDVDLKIGESLLFASSHGVEVHGRLLEGTFPDFNRVIPRSFLRHVEVEAAPFQAALRRLRLVAREKDSPDLVTFGFTAGKVVMSAWTPDVGAGKETLACDYEGEDLTIAFNAEYLTGAVSAVGTDRVRLDLQDESRSAVVRPVGEGAACECVVMPVRMREGVAA